MTIPKTPAFRAGCLLALAFALSGCTMDSGSSAPAAPDASDYGIPDSRERFAIQRDAIAEKLQAVLLPAMRNHGIDMWIVLDRENNEEPLHVELGGGFAGVRGAFIFHDNGSDTVEKLYYSSHEQPANSVISQVYDETIYYGYSREGLTPHLRKAIEDRDPQTIGVNTSHTLPEADGLTVGLRNFLVDAIGPEYASRIVSAELLVRDFRLQRTPAETAIYTDLLAWSARWMEEALSTENIVTGVTTAEDVSWWLLDRALELELTGGGTVRVVREGELLPIHDPDIALEPGDIVGIDGGLRYLHYAIDIKRTAYILKPGETAMPESLQEVWRTTHEVGDFYASMMVPGAVGFETWSAINAEMESAATARPDRTRAEMRPPPASRKWGCTAIRSATWPMTSARGLRPTSPSPTETGSASRSRRTSGSPSSSTRASRFPNGTARPGTRGSRRRRRSPRRG